MKLHELRLNEIAKIEGDELERLYDRVDRLERFIENAVRNSVREFKKVGLDLNFEEDELPFFVQIYVDRTWIGKTNYSPAKVFVEVSQRGLEDALDPSMFDDDDEPAFAGAINDANAQLAKQHKVKENGLMDVLNEIADEMADFGFTGFKIKTSSRVIKFADMKYEDLPPRVGELDLEVV